MDKDLGDSFRGRKSARQILLLHAADIDKKHQKYFFFSFASILSTESTKVYFFANEFL